MNRCASASKPATPSAASAVSPAPAALRLAAAPLRACGREGGALGKLDLLGGKQARAAVAASAVAATAGVRTNSHGVGSRGAVLAGTVRPDSP